MELCDPGVGSLEFFLQKEADTCLQTYMCTNAFACALLLTVCLIVSTG